MSCRKAATAATYGVCACTPRGADHWSPARPPPTLTHSVNIGKGAFGHPRLTKTNICRGGVSPPAPAQSYSFLYSIGFHTRFSLQEGGAKKSYQKKRRKGDAKRGLFEKSPLLNSRKNFPALTPNIGCAYPKRRVSRPAAPQVPQAVRQSGVLPA